MSPIHDSTFRRRLARRAAAVAIASVAGLAAADSVPSGDSSRLGGRTLVGLGGATIRAAAPAPDGGVFVVGGRSDGLFAARIAADLATTVWTRPIGGTAADRLESVAVAPDGAVWAAGTVASRVLPTPGGFQTSGSEAGDAFVVRLDPSSGALAYATFLGGLKEDSAASVAVDGTGRVFVAGRSGPDLPGRIGPAPSPSIFLDAYVTALDGTGALLWTRYLSGVFDDAATCVAAASDGSVWVGGGTNSVTGGGDFPAVGGPPWTTPRNGRDAFVAHVASDGAALLLSTVFGNPAQDEVTALALLPDGRVAVALAQDSLGIGGGESAPQYPSIAPLSLRTDDSKGPIGDTFYRRTRFAVLATDGAAWTTFTGFPATRISAIVPSGTGRVAITGLALGETTPGAYLPSQSGGDGDPTSQRAFVAWIDLDEGEAAAATRLDADGPAALAVPLSGAAVVVGSCVAPETANAAFRVPFPPAPVANLRAVRRTDTAADVSWTHAGPVAQFQIERRAAEPSFLDVKTVRETWYLRTRGAFAKVGTVPSSARSFTDTTLPDGGDHEYRVIAIAPDGGTRGGEFAACGTVNGRAPQITGARVVSQQGNRLTVAWDGPIEGDIAADVLGPWVLERTAPGALSAQFTAIPFPGRPSRFQVRAVRGADVSSEGDEIRADLTPLLVVSQTRGHVSVSPSGRARISGRGRFAPADGAPALDPTRGVPRGVLALSRMGVLAVPDAPDRLIHLRTTRSPADRGSPRGALRVDWKRGRFKWSARFGVSRDLDLRRAESPLHVTVGLALSANGGAAAATWTRTSPHDFRIDR